MSAPDPGWYADPTGSAGAFRWWDGAAWTRWLSRDPDVGPPEQAPTLTPPADPADAAGPPPRPAAAEPAEPALPVPHEPPGVRLPVAVALVVAVLVVAVVAVGAVVSASAQRVPSGPAVAPPADGPAGPAVVYDASSRTASVEELRLVLPAAPYVCDTTPRTALPTFRSLVVCNAPVHEDYDADGSDWSATTGLGLVPDSLVVEGDLQLTAARVFAALRAQFFADQETTEEDVERQSWDGAPAGRSEARVAEVHYAVEGVPSRYDRTIVLVVALEDGGHAVWFSSRPDDTPQATRAALDASLAGMTTR